MYKDYKKIGKENDRKTMADRKIALGTIDTARKEGKITRFQAAIQKGQINAYVNRIGRELTKNKFIDKYGEENFKKMEERDVHNAEVGLAIIARTLASAALIGLTVKAVKKFRE